MRSVYTYNWRIKTVPQQSLTPRTYSLDYKPANDVSPMVRLFSSFDDVRRLPRTPEKAEWLRAQGLDPEAAFPIQKAALENAR